MTGIPVKESSSVLPHRHTLRPLDPTRRVLGSAFRRRWFELWDRLSLRSRILAAIVLINIIAALAATAVVVYDARQAAQAEMAASMRVAERLVHAAVERSGAETPLTTLFRNLMLELGQLRHVRILFADSNGALPSLLPAEALGTAADPGTHVPGWFTALVRVDDIRREMKIVSDGRLRGSVVLVGHPADEIAEVWRDTKHLAIIALAVNLTVIAILYFTLGRLLDPLTGLAQGLRKLERGQFRHRLSRPRIRELAYIADHFNALADRLRAAKADNGRLTRRLVSVQDDERRQIAAELHDEIGPCLFGMKANIASLDQLASEAGGKLAAPLRERVATLGEITDRIQMLNRGLLGRIRPMALGHVPLAEIVTGLAADFERLNPQTKVTTVVGPLADSYGDSVDLTVYRCLQEGITNAERHARANTVTVALSERGGEPGDGPEALSVLCLSVRDDGPGMARRAKRGLGLTAMEERVRALGGTVTVAGTPDGGTRLEVTIPLAEAPRGCEPGESHR